MNPPIRIISRFNEPTKLDTADYLTLCKVGFSHEAFPNYYIQTNVDSEFPKWEALGSLKDDNILVNLIDHLK